MLTVPKCHLQFKFNSKCLIHPPLTRFSAINLCVFVCVRSKKEREKKREKEFLAQLSAVWAVCSNYIVFCKTKIIQKNQLFSENGIYHELSSLHPVKYWVQLLTLPKLKVIWAQQWMDQIGQTVLKRLSHAVPSRQAVAGITKDRLARQAVFRIVAQIESVSIKLNSLNSS